MGWIFCTLLHSTKYFTTSLSEKELSYLSECRLFELNILTCALMNLYKFFWEIPWNSVCVWPIYQNTLVLPWLKAALISYLDLLALQNTDLNVICDCFDERLTYFTGPTDSVFICINHIEDKYDATRLHWSYYVLIVYRILRIRLFWEYSQTLCVKLFFLRFCHRASA
jgi:hypothetical protein